MLDSTGSSTTALGSGVGCGEGVLNFEKAPAAYRKGSTDFFVGVALATPAGRGNSFTLCALKVFTGSFVAKLNGSLVLTLDGLGSGKEERPVTPALETMSSTETFGASKAVRSEIVEDSKSSGTGGGCGASERKDSIKEDRFG